MTGCLLSAAFLCLSGAAHLIAFEPTHSPRFLAQLALSARLHTWYCMSGIAGLPIAAGLGAPLSTHPVEVVGTALFCELLCVVSWGMLCDVREEAEQARRRQLDTALAAMEQL